MAVGRLCPVLDKSLLSPSAGFVKKCSSQEESRSRLTMSTCLRGGTRNLIYCLEGGREEIIA